MARIAYVGVPAHGHTNPTVPVVRELVARGHEVRYYQAESFRAALAPTGVDFRPLPGPLPDGREISERLRGLVDASLLIAELSRPLARFLLEELSREPADLVLYDSIAMWGYIAARTRGVPDVCLLTTFVLDGSARAIGVGTLLRHAIFALPHVPRLIRWRRKMAREFGSTVSGGITEYAKLNLVFTSRELHPPNAMIEKGERGRFVFVGASLDPALREPVPFPFERLSDGPTVYASLGTIHSDRAFYRSLFEAFDGAPEQLIVSVAGHGDDAPLDGIPENVIVRSSVPQLELLPRVDAFITHGGMNSVHEGLYFGVPEIVVPHHFEQLLNGRQVARTGSGILLGSGRARGGITGSRLRSAVAEVLDDPRYRERAARMGETLRAAGGYRRAADEIEAELARRAPNGETAAPGGT